jgi:hypothetical protein
LNQLFEKKSHQPKDKYYLAPLEAIPNEKDDFVPKSAARFVLTIISGL